MSILLQTDLPHELNLTGGYDYMTNTFTAVCTSSTYPAPTLTWQYSGGTPDPGRYSEDTNVGITLSTSTLEISPFEVEDDNITITCTSTSTQGVMVDFLVPEYGEFLFFMMKYVGRRNICIADGLV